LGLKFYNGKGFGSEYQNAIFLARHGSWNKSVKIGGDVLAIKLNSNGTVKSIEPFITGFIQNNAYVGRPVDVLPMPDGSMLVSDDFNGAVYRVSRGSARVAGK
jgi:glucose/arabinose dehydrogenase